MDDEKKVKPESEVNVKALDELEDGIGIIMTICMIKTKMQLVRLLMQPQENVSIIQRSLCLVTR